MTACAACGKPAQSRVQNISRRTRKVLTDEPLCAEHVQREITLAATPDLGMTDIEILPLPPAEQPSVSSRGFKCFDPVPDDRGGSVTVYESSAASSMRIWLSVVIEGSGSAAAHLPLAAAERLRDQLTYLIENHYQKEGSP